MYQALEISALLLAAITMALSLAHALELPGKFRLPRDTYVAAQAIYYPGFTIGGAAEPLSILVLLALVLVTPDGAPAFWLRVAALVLLALVHAVFWIWVQPANRYWLTGTDLSATGRRFFGLTPATGSGTDWRVRRNRWEYAHVVRAALALSSLILLSVAITE